MGREGEELSIEARRLEGGVMLLKLRGSLDLDSTPKLSAVLDDLAPEGRHRAVLDLSQVDHVSSVGWGMLLDVAAKLERVGGGMRLVAISEGVRKIYDLLELGYKLKSVASVEEAVQDFLKD